MKRAVLFQGVGFRIDEVELSEKMRKVYDESVKFWVDLMHRYINFSLNAHT